jgi:hypothetical protein
MTPSIAQETELISWEEAEKRYARHSITFAEKIELLKGLDDRNGFIAAVIAGLEGRLTAWKLDHKQCLDEIKKQPEEWVRKFLVDALIVIYGKDIAGTHERIVELELMRSLLADNKKRRSYEGREAMITAIKKIPIQSLVVLNKLRTTSSRIQACCPFHNDTRPSLTIFLKDNHFKCWSCGTGGDVISFWMALNNVTFNEALEALGGKL